MKEKTLRENRNPSRGKMKNEIWAKYGDTGSEKKTSGGGPACRQRKNHFLKKKIWTGEGPSDNRPKTKGSCAPRRPGQKKGKHWFISKTTVQERPYKK